MFGISMQELIIVLVLALIIIGPKKLPDLAKSLGRALGEFKKAANDFKETISMESTLNEVKNEFKEIKEKVSEPFSMKSTAGNKDSETEPSSKTDEMDSGGTVGDTTETENPETPPVPDETEMEKTAAEGAKAADSDTSLEPEDIPSDSSSPGAAPQEGPLKDA